MTKVKPESQPTPITQAQSIDEPATASESIAERTASMAESTTKATSTRKPRAKTASTTKRQGINKTPSQSATTRVKLPPETTQVDDLAIQVKQLTEQVKHLREQVSGSETRLEESTSADTQLPKRTRSLNSVQLPLESPRPSQTSVKSPQTSIPSFRPTTSFPAARPRRRSPLHRLIQRSLRLPEQNSGIAVASLYLGFDAALWVFAAAGLRIGLKYLVMAVPILNFPVILLMFVPALLAAYAALFIPKANRIGIYRLLLVSLGLFVGGRL